MIDLEELELLYKTTNKQENYNGETFVQGHPPFRYAFIPLNVPYLDCYTFQTQHAFIENLRDKFEEFCLNKIRYIEDPTSKTISQCINYMEEALYRMFGESMDHKVVCSMMQTDTIGLYPVLKVMVWLKGYHYQTLEFSL